MLRCPDQARISGHEFVQACLGMVRDIFRGRAKLIAENALLRQQVVVLKRGASRPRLMPRDRWSMAAITKVFPALLDTVIIVRPETVIRWHRSLWRLLLRHRSRRPAGHPPVDADTRALIRRMWQENPVWGEDVIAAELAKLGHHVSPRTVAKYRPTHLPRGRGQKWSSHLELRSPRRTRGSTRVTAHSRWPAPFSPEGPRSSQESP